MATQPATGKPGLFDLVFDQGSTFEREVQLRDENKNLIDLDGYTAELEVRPFPGDTAAPLLTLETNPTIDGNTGNARIVVTTGSDSKLTLTVTAADMAALAPWDRAVYDLVVEDANGVRTTILEGKAIFRRKVTVVS